MRLSISIPRRVGRLGLPVNLTRKRPIYHQGVSYGGPLEAGERIVSPVQRFGTPIADLVRPKSSLKMITLADLGAPAGQSYSAKASTLSDLSDEASKAMVAYGSTCTSLWSHVLIQPVHGAASRVGPTETAFALRGES